MTPEPPCRPTKTCTACHETKPLTDFHRDKKSAGGRRNDCKTCAKARNRKRGPQALTAVADNACAYPGCRRNATATSSGLCGTHHATLSGCRESPLALTGGQWVAGKGGVRRWVA